MALNIENGWWNEGGLWQDLDLDTVKRSSLKYRPDVFKVGELRRGGIFTLRGPRRSGKTVTLKLLVSQLIEKKGVEGRQIFWTSLDTIRTLSQMESHLRECLSLHPIKFLFVDEVTSVVGWQKVVKKLKDEGLLSNVCTVLTGSSAHDLKKGSERMAGRKGGVFRSDRVLLPMDYREFLKQVPFPEGKNVQSYLQVGGFPFRVEHFVNKRESWDPLQEMEVFDDVFFYEINRRRLDRNIAIELLARLSDIQNHAVSYEGVTKPLSVAKETVRKYLNALGESLKKRLPFEMKYQSHISDWDFQVMERAFGKGFLITKDFKKKRKKSEALSLGQWMKQG